MAIGALSACVQAPRQRVMAPAMRAPASPPQYFYPAQGQDAARLDRDRFECFQWARVQTQSDPALSASQVPAPLYVSPPQVTGAGAAVGGATGALVGAAASGGNGAGGLVLGAVLGSMIGAASENANAQAVAQAQAQAEAQRARQAPPAVPLASFRRAMGACMGGRGYTVG